jgi:hypothetical protein
MAVNHLWSGRRGCYVILHVKPLIFGHVRAHVIVYAFEPILLLFILMIWYHRHYYVGMMWYHPRL